MRKHKKTRQLTSLLLIHVEDDVFGKASFIQVVLPLESHQLVVLHDGGIWGAADVSIETRAGGRTAEGEC